MFKIKQRAKKTFSVVGIFGLIFIQALPLGAQALVVPDSLINNVTTATNSTVINSADNDLSGINNKTQGPKVEVVFNSSVAIKSGAKITATATPSFFNNASDPKKLYFTWYLKREGCELANSPSDQTISKCDFDGNRKITENDWKIAAARIIIKGSFDSTGTNYGEFSNGQSESTAGYKAIPSPKASDDEWRINSGEDDTNSIDAPNCYVQEPKSGLIYEMRRVRQIFDECPDINGVEHEKSCISTMTTSCNVLNSAYETTALGGAPYPDPVPIKSLTGTADVCGVKTKDDDAFNCSISDLTNYETTLSCDDGKGVSMCVPKSGGDLSITDTSDKTTKATGKIYGEDKFNDPDNLNGVCGDVFEENTHTTDPTIDLPLLPDALMPLPNFFETIKASYTSSNKNCSTLKSALVDGTKNEDDSVALVGNTNYDPTCSFEKDDNMCKHLFPKIPGAVTGDGKFTLEEKEFWGADPGAVSTNGTGKDEEAAVGLGADKFAWTYSTGDEVGVVVEGESAFQTEHADASFKRMWAFSNHTCNALKDFEPDNLESKDLASDGNNEGKIGFYLEGNDTAQRGFLTAEIDLDDCLEENLLDPMGESDNNSALKVELNATPANPINDPNGNGDILTVTSTPANTENPNTLLYTWSVQKSRAGSNSPDDTTTWQEITNGMTIPTGGSFSSTDLMGLGKKDLAINLNLKEALIESGMNAGTYSGGVFYLRIKLKIKGGAVDGSQDAMGFIIIRINNQQNKIGVYPVLATVSGKLSMDNGSGTTTLCSDGATCYVNKNQIVGIAIPETSKSSNIPFIWTINGEPISCSSSISAQCANGNVLFFPVLGNVGELINVVAKGIDENGEAIEIVRQFVIIEDGLRITSLNDNAFPKLLGYYKSGSSYCQGSSDCPNLSTEVWQTTEGKTVTFGASGQTGFNWAIDGQIIPEFKDKQQIQIFVDKVDGESYNIGLSTYLTDANKAQRTNQRTALRENWGISAEDAVDEDENKSANVQLDVLAGSSQPVAKAETGSLSASLITHLPEQLVFLFKISLTSILLLLGTGILFAFIPETLFKEEK